MNKAVLLLAVYAALITGAVLGYTLNSYLSWKTDSVPVAVASDGLYHIQTGE